MTNELHTPPRRSDIGTRLAALRQERDRDAIGLPKPTGRTAQAASVPKTKPAPAAKTYCQADLDRAAMTARYAERARWSDTFALAASHGRERVCAVLLAKSNGYSAAHLAKHLAHMPTDAEQSQERAARKQAAINATWESAIEQLGINR